MNLKNFALVALLAAVVAVVVAFAFRQPPLLGNYSQLSTEKQWFGGSAFLGGGSKTVSNGGGGTTTSTLTAVDICDNLVFSWNAVNIASATLPSGASLQDNCLKNGGVHFSKDVVFRNTGTGTIDFVTGASSTFMFLASSTTDLPFVSGTVVSLKFVSVPEGGKSKVEIYKATYTPR